MPRNDYERWQIHPFCEGNTRSTAVFIIKYLKTFGFLVNLNYSPRCGECG